MPSHLHLRSQEGRLAVIAIEGIHSTFEIAPVLVKSSQIIEPTASPNAICSSIDHGSSIFCLQPFLSRRFYSSLRFSLLL